MSLSPLLFDQVDIQLSGQSGETGTNGVIMNAIPKAGGNRFSGSALANGSGPSLQGSNVTDDLKARGAHGRLVDAEDALRPQRRRRRSDQAGQGVVLRHVALLHQRVLPGVAATTRWTRRRCVRTDDTSKQAYGGTYTYDNNGRVTWAINDKQKLSGWYAYQYKVDPHWLIQRLQRVAGSRAHHRRGTRSSPRRSGPTRPRTSCSSRPAWRPARAPTRSSSTRIRSALCPSQGSLAPRCISITEQTAGNFFYRAPTGFDFDDRLPSQSFNGSMSYVTGSHNAKFGLEMQRGHFWRGDNNDSTGGIWYTTTRWQRPALVTIQSPVAGWQNNLNYNLGIYAQDRWTLDRLTLSGGVRLDMQNESTEPFTATAAPLAAEPQPGYGAVKNVPNWKDINPRVSVAYDVFGNGKTALKGSASRGVEQDSIRYAGANNPASTLVTQTNRAWDDGNGDCVTDSNFVPAVRL